MLLFLIARLRRRFHFLAFLLVCVSPSVTLKLRADEARVLAITPQEFSLPSQSPSGNEVNDRIWVVWYEPILSSTRSTQKNPAVILLHYLGTANNREMHRFARYLSERGIAAAVMTLPYHMKRLTLGDRAVQHYFASDPDSGVQAFRQAASDVSTVITWISAQPEIDEKRIGIAGISLGAIVTHLTMGKDERISAGVAILGAGDLPEIYRHSVVGHLFFKTDSKLLDAAAIKKIREIDPLTYADKNRPRRVLMIEAARDSFIPVDAAEKTWNALGRPPIQWIDTNHMALALLPKQAMRLTLAYLQSVWNDSGVTSSTRSDAKLPKLYVPTIKTGVIFGLDSVATPAITLQTFSLGTTRHMALFHADVGVSGRGPFFGLAATVNQYADIGLGRRFAGKKFNPYVSLHIVF